MKNVLLIGDSIRMHYLEGVGIQDLNPTRLKFIK